MNFADLLSGFINMEIFGMALILIAMGNIMVKHFGCNRKKVPQFFIVVALPLNTLYNLCSNPDMHIFVTVMDSLYQSIFSVVIAMGLYDLGKSLWQSFKYQIKRANPINRKQEENL